MIDLKFPLRIATAQDAAVLAELVNHAGEGMPEYLWTSMAAADEDPWEIGRKRQEKKAEEGQIFVVDEGKGAIAGLTGYAISADPDPLPDDMPAMFRPLQELENLAPATWYVNVLAALPDHRGQGWGTHLLDLAEAIARDEDLSGLSLVVADNNDNARRLYERVGYRERARRTMIKEGWRSEGDEWILLVRDFA